MPQGKRSQWMKSHSSPHGTEKGWLLPGPVACRRAAGMGKTPQPTARGCRRGAGSWHRAVLSPRDSARWHPGTPTVGMANTRLDASLLAQPTRWPSLLPVQCCQVLPPRTKPPLVAQRRRMTQSSSGADIGGLASGGPSTGTPLPSTPPCPGRRRSAQPPRGLSHSLLVGPPPRGCAASLLGC